MYLYTCVRACLCVHGTCVYVCRCLCFCIGMCVCVCIYIYVLVCVHCVSLCVHECVCVWVCVCVCLCVHTSMRGSHKVPPRPYINTGLWITNHFPAYFTLKIKNHGHLKSKTIRVNFHKPNEDQRGQRGPSCVCGSLGAGPGLQEH